MNVTLRFWGWVGAMVVAGIIPSAILPRSGYANAQPVVSTPSRTATTGKTSRIDAAQIRLILDAIDAASKQRNTDAVISYIAPNAVIELTVLGMTGEQTMRLNREQYRQYLQQGFKMTKDYTSTYSDLKIQVKTNGKSAIATYLLTESLGVTEPTIAVTALTDSSLQFDLINGKILATKIRWKSKLQMK